MIHPYLFEASVCALCLLLQCIFLQHARAATSSITHCPPVHVSLHACMFFPLMTEQCLCSQEKVLTQKEREEEEMGNAMKALENRTLESKREMDIMAALDEMRTLNSRHSKVRCGSAVSCCVLCCVLFHLCHALAVMC